MRKHCFNIAVFLLTTFLILSEVVIADSLQVFKQYNLESILPRDSLTLSFDEAITLALENNRQIKMARARKKASDFGVKGAITSFLPRVTGSGAYVRLDERPYIDASGFGSMFEPLMDPFTYLVDNGYLDPTTLEGLQGGGTDKIYVGQRDNYVFGISVSQPIFTGGALLNSFKIAKLNAKSEKWNLERDENNVRKDVSEAYFNLIKVRGFLKVAKESVGQLEVHITDLENFMAEGMIIENDLLKARVRLYEVRLMENQAANGVELASAYLCHLLDIDLDTWIVTIDVPKPDTEKLDNLESYTSKAIKYRPEIQSIDAVKGISKKLISLEKSKYLPSLFLIGNYDWKRPDRQYEPVFYGSWNITLVMQMDVFSWGGTHFNVQKAKYNSKQIEQAARMLEDGISIEVKQTYLTLLEKRRAVELSGEGLKQAKENYRVTHENFYEGISTNTDLLDAQADLTRAEIGNINSNVDLLIAYEKFKHAIAGY